jgi:hypothetical protein
MKKTYTIRINRDGTLTIRVGRYVEHITLESKTKGELYDHVKYALVSKECFISDERLTQDLYSLLYG